MKTIERMIKLISNGNTNQLYIRGVVIGANNISPDNILKKYYEIQDGSLRNKIIKKAGVATGNVYLKDDELDVALKMLAALERAIIEMQREADMVAHKVNSLFNELNVLGCGYQPIAPKITHAPLCYPNKYL